MLMVMEIIVAAAVVKCISVWNNDKSFYAIFMSVG